MFIVDLHVTIRTMPCPFFLPLERFDAGISMRFPLGEPYRGECRASSEPHTPIEDTLLAICNMGYAAGRCPRFVPDGGPDAVRFAMGRGESILYAREKNHFPFDSGEITVFEGILGAQAEAFRKSYLRRIAHG
jgi:hypothetical protein